MVPSIAGVRLLQDQFQNPEILGEGECLGLGSMEKRGMNLHPMSEGLGDRYLSREDEGSPAVRIASGVRFADPGDDVVGPELRPISGREGEQEKIPPWNEG